MKLYNRVALEQITFQLLTPTLGPTIVPAQWQVSASVLSFKCVSEYPPSPVGTNGRMLEMKLLAGGRLYHTIRFAPQQMVTVSSPPPFHSRNTSNATTSIWVYYHFRPENRRFIEFAPKHHSINQCSQILPNL